MFSVTFKEPWVIQRFLPNVKHGDKRIILVDGEFAGAVNRVPAADDLRSNMVRGGSPKETELTPREREICERLGPHRLRVTLVRDRGVLLADSKITHSYPHCWRHKTPVAFRTTPQWFISMEKEGLREAAHEVGFFYLTGHGVPDELAGGLLDPDGWQASFLTVNSRVGGFTDWVYGLDYGQPGGAGFDCNGDGFGDVQGVGVMCGAGDGSGSWRSGRTAGPRLIAAKPAAASR